jgi:asparagine synthase (glutamine-hydrolysing)
MRAPYLDVNFAEFAVSIPQKYKFYRSKGKRILKDLTHMYIPKKIMDRPKNGFSVPIGRWLQNELKNELIHYCDTEFLLKQNIFNVKETQELIRDFLNTPLITHKGEKYDSFIWSFFVFQQWYERYYLNSSIRDE